MGATVTATERQKKINEVQEARRAVRRAKKSREALPVEAKLCGVNFGEAPLHELFAKCKKIAASNFRSVDPVHMVRKSPEYRRAVALCSVEMAEAKIRESGLIK